MLKIDCLTLGAYQSNTYFVRPAGATECVIIDPGYAPRTILDKLRALGLQCAAIALTHGHFDHVGAAEEVAAAEGCPLWISPEDWAMSLEPSAAPFFPLDHSRIRTVRFFSEDAPLTVSGLHLSVLKTPGHTPGSVCLQAGDALLTGDTLFAGSCGRTDFPGGSMKQMMASLARLAALPGDYRVLPGHMEPSTLDRERRFNPYMQMALREQG